MISGFFPSSPLVVQEERFSEGLSLANPPTIRGEDTKKYFLKNTIILRYLFTKVVMSKATFLLISVVAACQPSLRPTRRGRQVFPFFRKDSRTFSKTAGKQAEVTEM
jgi:hypothetical protein